MLRCSCTTCIPTVRPFKNGSTKICLEARPDRTDGNPGSGRIESVGGESSTRPPAPKWFTQRYFHGRGVYVEADLRRELQTGDGSCSVHNCLGLVSRCHRWQLPRATKRKLYRGRYPQSRSYQSTSNHKRRRSQQQQQSSRKCCRAPSCGYAGEPCGGWRALWAWEIQVHPQAGRSSLYL